MNYHLKPDVIVKSSINILLIFCSNDNLNNNKNALCLFKSYHAVMTKSMSMKLKYEIDNDLNGYFYSRSYKKLV